MNNNVVKKLVVVGGGTAGRFAAAALANQLKPEYYEITVIESSHIGATSVGESLVPPVAAFIRDLGVDEQEFIAQTGAGYKLGIQFCNWLEKDSSFFHPFGRLGRALNGHDFFQCWLKARAEGDRTPLSDYSPAAVLARARKFTLPAKLPLDSPLTGLDYAFHLDSKDMNLYFREYAERRNVKHIQAHVVRVNKAENGNIQSLELNNRQTVEGDFFIDCTGTRGMLIGEALDSPLESWSDLLPCDRAVTVQSDLFGPVDPYSTYTAREYGWSWKIPLKNRCSVGYVFSSRFCSDDEAARVLLDSVETDPASEPTLISIRQGARIEQWKKNCIAIGLSSGFLEPLESSSIYLATRGINQLLALFPNLHRGEQDWPGLAAQFNTRMLMEYEEIRDFITLHYFTTQRSDTEFWRLCQSLPVPDALAARLELFRERGELEMLENGLFKASSWQALFTGMNIFPGSYHPFMDLSDFKEIHQAMQSDQQGIRDAADAV